MADMPITPEIAAAVAPGKDLDPSTIPTTPIPVSMGSATPTGALASLRYFVVLALAFAAGKGWISKDDAVQIPMLLAAAIPAYIGVMSAIKSHNAKAALEPYAPAEVAVRK